MLQRRSPGFALALTLFLILLLATICFAALSVSTLDMRAARQDHDSSKALYASRAGLSFALSQLSFDYGWRSGSGSLGDESYSVTVVPRSNNGTSTDKMWQVTSTGSYQGASRTVVAYVVLESFAKFAYFTDQEFTVSNSPIWFFGGDRIDGVVHTNGYFRMAGNPQYSNRVTSANTGDSLYDAGDFTYDQDGTQTDPARFYRVYDDYDDDYPVALDDSPLFSFAGGQARIPLPQDASMVASNADHVYDRDTRLQFRDDGTVAVSRYSRGRWRHVETVQTDTQPGVTIFVDGELYVEGTVHGRVTLGADEDVHVTGDLVYADEDRDVLGIVGEEDIIVDSDPYRSRDRYIHASMMALNGSFTVDDYDEGYHRGTLHVFGGIIQNRRGPVGTFSGGSASTGYTKDYTYDDKLVNKPPLNFPTTGKIVVRSILDKGSLGSTT